MSLASRSSRSIRRRAARRGNSRRGLSTIWLLIALPTLLVLFCFVINIANLWLARVELENALEAAALAAVLEWGQAGGGPTADPRDAGVAYAAANRVRGMELVIATNLDPAPGPGNPNENLTCDVQKTPPMGNLIFGAIIDDDPLTFDAGAIPSCTSADVLIEICKANAASATVPDMFGVFYRDGTPGVSITAVEIELPIPLDDMGNPQDPDDWPYWDTSFATNGRKPKVSISDDPDDKNLNNSNPAPIVPPINGTDETYDARGLNVAPTVPSGGNPENSDWSCPNPNGSGICFNFDDLVPGETERARTLRINFNPGEFEPPSNPNDDSTWEFIRFGASLNGFGPPAYPGGDNNDGDMFGLYGAKARVFFSDNTSCEVEFVDTGGDDDRSEAVCGGGTGEPFAVRAQAIVNVPIMCGPFFLFAEDSYCVSANATAMYDCNTGRARLVRIRNENFICP